MPKSVKSPARAVTNAPASSMDKTTVALVCAAAWLVPGAGHLWLGRRRKGLIFLGALTTMFVIGLALEGRLFPVEPAQPLVALAAVAELGVGLVHFAARLLGYGAGTVVAATYEYGNTYLIVAGLLNFLVMLDVFDIATGRKLRT